jgi:polyisoprenoid-binding protein YceI
MRLSRQAAALHLFLLAGLAAAPARAETRLLVLDPAASRVSFSLAASGHDVEGGLAVKSGRITFDPATGDAAGEIAVDVVSAATGNKSRDNTMHKEVLETARWPLALFRAEKLRGTLAPMGVSKVALEGTLALHGVEHKVILPAKVEIQNGHLMSATQVAIPFVDWGLHDPSILFFRVAKVVSVKILAEGSLQTGDPAALGTK